MSRNRDSARAEDEAVSYYLVRGSDIDGDATDEHADSGLPADEEQLRREDHHTKVVALAGLAVVVVMVAVTIALISLIDTSGLPAPGSPHAAAQQWGNALVTRDHGRLRQLECARGSSSGDVLDLIIVAATAAHAGTAITETSDRWHVPLEIDGPDGSTQGTATLTVVREKGRYRVC